MQNILQDVCRTWKSRFGLAAFFVGRQIGSIEYLHSKKKIEWLHEFLVFDSMAQLEACWSLEGCQAMSRPRRCKFPDESSMFRLLGAT